MFESKEIQLSAKDVKSLCWDGDTLVDWVAGGHRYSLDGHYQPRHVAYSFIFDSAVISPSGEYAAIYVKRGTKGLILHKGKIIREVNRSFYYAHAYEYPIVLFQLGNGQEVLAHCPDRYCQLEIEDIATGKRITDLDTREPTDFFFSRLATSTNGAFLFSAGWHWHPVDHVKVFNIEEALKNPSHFDSQGLEVDTWADSSSACFVGNDQLVVALSTEVYEDEDDEDNNKAESQNEKGNQLPFGELRVFDLKETKLLSTVNAQAMVGTIMPIGKRHIIGFYEYPKLIDLQTGAVIQSWPHIKSGKQTSSIIWHIEAVPPMAFDAVNWRFAVANESEITIVQIAKPGE